MTGLPPAIFVMGPTASGKTDLACEIADHLPCDLISVDSALIYRGMDIGTAKPSAEELARHPHRLIDIREPTEAYSAARFRADALREMADVSAAKRIPLLVGGTMLYFRALQHGLADMPPADEALRARLSAEAERVGWAALHSRLAGIDPVAAERIHPNDPQRLQRALEVWELTGRPLSELQAEQARNQLPYATVKLVCMPSSRDLLRNRIAARFDRMLEFGLIDEVSRLLAIPGMQPDLPAMRAVGYRQVAGYLLGEYDKDEMIQRAVHATRQLAKRQLTWLRKEADVTNLDCQATDRWRRLKPLLSVIV